VKGFLYRRAAGLKDLGERLRWDWLVRLGLKIREGVLRYGKAEQPGGKK
jgi:hypothetical protein